MVFLMVKFGSLFCSMHENRMESTISKNGLK